MRFFKDSKMILHLAMPLLSSRLTNIIVFFLGFVMIAKLGTEEFAASSLAYGVFATLIMIGVGILYAVGIKISHAFGAKDNEKIREYLYSGILLAVLLALAAMFFLIILSFLLPHLGQKPTLIPYAKTFMYAFCLPMIPAMLSLIPNQLVTALLKPRIIFVSSIVNVPITIGLLYWFIFGGLGIPSLGIWGFGLAFLIGDIFLMLIPVAYILTNPYFKQFNLLDFSNVGKNLVTRMVEILRLGIPMGVQFGAEIAVFSVITFLIGRFGAFALSAFQIATQILIVSIMIPFTFSEAAAILVGQADGRKDPIDIRSYGFSSVKLGIVFSIIVAIIFFTVPKLLISVYINVKDPSLANIVNLGVLFLYVSAISQIFDSIRNIITGALRGLHDSKYPMYVGIFVMWLISLPIGLLAADVFHLGPIGFSIGTTVAVLVGAIILLIRFHRKTVNLQFS